MSTALVLGLMTGPTAAQFHDVNARTESTDVVHRWIGGFGLWSVPTNWDPPMFSAGGVLLDGIKIDRDNPLLSTVTLDVSATVSDLVIDANDALTINPSKLLTVEPGSFAARIENAGVITLVDGSIPASLVLNGGGVVPIRGGGEIIMENASLSVFRGATMTETAHLVNQTLRGAGNLGLGSMSIINDGSILADRPFKELKVFPNIDGVINNGVMQATGSGRLNLIARDFHNNGVIEAVNNGRVELIDSTIIGGTLRSEGTGRVRAQVTTAALDGVTFEGELEIGATELTLRGSIQNDGLFDFVGDDAVAAGEGLLGTITLDSGDGPVTLGGDGSFKLLDTIITGTGTQGVVTHGPDHLLFGSGTIDASNMVFVNDGTIDADIDDLLIIILSPTHTFTNNGSLVASNIAGWLTYGGLFTNNGVIEVLNGSKATFAAGTTVTNGLGGTLSGGTWRVISTGAVTTLEFPGVNFLINNADVTLSGNNSVFAKFDHIAINSGRISLENGRVFNTDVWIINDGEIEVDSKSAMNVNGDLTLHDSGTIQLGVSTQNTQVGHIVVDDLVELGGTFRIEVEGSGDVPLYEILTFVESDGLFGSFDSVEVPDGLELTYTDDAIVGMFTTDCFADFDGDGMVGTLDLVFLTGNWGMCPDPPLPCPWDLNGNGIVGSDDLLLLTQHWGPCPE